MDREVFYKLRNRETGLFRCKGMWGKWTKQGDRWSSLGHLKQHLGQFPATKVDWDNWEVVEYLFTPVEAGTVTLLDLLK